MLSWKNTFVVPLFYKIVRRLYAAHISHRTNSVTNSFQVWIIYSHDNEFHDRFWTELVEFT